MSRRQSELSLVLDAYRRLRGRANLSVRCHVPVLGRCADLAYVTNDVLVTVEFKLHDWQRALRQARDHRLAADLAYVCMPRRTITDAMRKRLLEHGVGFFAFVEQGDWPFDVILDAARSDDVWQVLRRETCNYVRQEEEQPS